MKKVYEPLNMIKNGRYAVLYGKLAPELQQQVLSRMAELIEEDKEYEDKGNYGNLHNIDFIRTKTLCQGGDCCDFCFVRKHPGGAVTIDTSTLKASEGCFGPTPLLIHLDSLECISKIEPLPNAETPAYWQLVLDKLSTAWNGIPADKVKDLKVDAVSGATYSSEGFISNVQTGIAYYLESK